MSVSTGKAADAATAAFAADVQAQRRAFWRRQILQWHWISAAIALIGMLGFAITGITLNHAAQITTRPEVSRLQATLPEALRLDLAARVSAAAPEVPAGLQQWLQAQWSLRGIAGVPEWSEDEFYLSLPRPGGDAWLSVDLASGEVEYERTDRGWISYFNDLHKGRHAGLVWSGFIDVLAIACVVFSLSGLFLLQIHARRRPGTWPFVALGLLIPVLLALLFIH